MMDCERAAEQISAQLDGELSPSETAWLEAHLEQCPSCRALQADFQALHQALLDAAAQWTAEPPADLTQRVLERVHAAKTVPFQMQKNRWRRWASLAAVLALVVIGGGVFVHGQNGASGGAAGDAALVGAGPQTDGAAVSAPESKEAAVPEDAADADSVQANGEDGIAAYSAANEPQLTSAMQSSRSGAEDPDALPSYVGANDERSLNTEDPDETAPPGVQPYSGVQEAMTIVLNGELFCYWGAEQDSADGLNDVAALLSKGYEPLGQLPSDTEAGQSGELPLQANFSASGAVYANAEDPDHIYVCMSTDWFTGVQRFDRVPTEDE